MNGKLPVGDRSIPHTPCLEKAKRRGGGFSIPRKVFQQGTLLALVVTVVAGTAWAAPEAPGFLAAEGERTWAFPRDHGQHPAYRIEWWYYTGHLEGPGGRRFGFQVTFFRLGLRARPGARASAWATGALYSAHAALSDLTRGRFRHAGRAARDGLDLAGAATHRHQVWVGPWRADALPDDPHGTRLTVRAPDFALELTLHARTPPVLHGRGGLDRKGPAPGQASWYYSLPDLAATGTVAAGGETVPVQGSAWMDHEFGTSQLGPEREGWDWWALRLSDGHALMLYRLRARGGGTAPFSGGTLIDPAGRGTPFDLAPDGPARLRPTRHWESPDGTRYPVAWRIELPTQGLALDVTPELDAQELTPTAGVPFPYWEGAVRVAGTHAGRAVTGRGYQELAGYAGDLSAAFR